MNPRPNVIVWAIDPFEESTQPIRKAFERIRGWGDAALTRVVPVYVRRRAWFESSPLSALQTQTLVDLEIANARKELGQRLGEVIDPRKWEPVVVTQANDSSIRTQVEALLAVARRERADLVVTATHANRGADRWLLGSFAETLIQRSELPVLAINPHVDDSKGSHRRILFATDFSSESAAAFAKILPHARQMGSEVRLFHRFWFDQVPEPGSAYSLGSVYEQLSRDVLKQTHASLEKWIAQAAAAGVRATGVVDDSPGHVADLILRSAGDCDFIALATQSGPVLSALGGSTTRKVLRRATCPVWTFHD